VTARSWWLVATIVLAACGGRPPVAVTPTPDPRAEIDALVRRGCYACLEQAFATSTAAGVGDAAYETALLLALRSKELGMPDGRWIAAARERIPDGGGWRDYLEMVLSVPADPLSADRDDLLRDAAAHRKPRMVLQAWRYGLADGPGSLLFRAYLDISLACGPLLYNQRDEAMDGALRWYGDVPLIQYRVGACGRTLLLAEALANEPALVDAQFELGRAELQREQADHDEALRRFRLAQAAFPTSATIAAAIGMSHQQREEWPEAVAAYEAAMALVPTHRDALLGLAIGFSHLSRHHDAIAATSRLIELGFWYAADAHYWRAWNEYRVDDLTAAREDIDRAKALDPTPPALLLSGLVAWREKRIDAAETEFQAALDRDYGLCDAATYLGGVRAERRRWPESLAAFQHAEQCSALSVAANRQAIADLSATQAGARSHARRIESLERAVAEAERRRDEAARHVVAIRRQLGVSAPAWAPPATVDRSP
jgi:tetratricopeptide (TPR) repeat protein